MRPPPQQFEVLRIFSFLIAIYGLSLVAQPANALNVISVPSRSLIQEDENKNETVQNNRNGYLIEVRLPIDSNVKLSVKKSLQQIAEKSPVGLPADQRPVVVLKFESTSETTGRGSEIGACLDLAELLGKPEMQRLHTVAYIAASADSVETKLNGHAVLVAIATNEIAMEPGTMIGAAGIDDPKTDQLAREMYKKIATQRLTTVPVEVALAMLDREQGLVRVVTKDSRTIYVSAVERAEWEKGDKSKKTDSITSSGSFAELTRAQMEEFGFVQLKPDSKTDLARELNLKPRSLESAFGASVNRNAIQVHLPNYIDDKSSQWLLRNLNDEISREQVNLVIFNIDSNEGEIDACLRIAQRLAEFNPEKVRTVAFVREHATGPVGLIALSCTEMIMAPNSRLGGKGEVDPNETANDVLDEQELAEIKPLVQAIAKKKKSDWSLMMSMIDPSTPIWRYSMKDKPDQVRILGEEEHASLDDKEDWVKLRQIGGEAGIDASTAAAKSIAASTIADDMSQIQTLFNLEEFPRAIQPVASDRWVGRFANFLASPFVAPWLIFGAMFFFSTEMSAPGLGLPGFLATICFALFFWSQMLGGNAEWFEVILFLVGILFVMIEIFVLPGFGIFGIGGLLMLIVSVVLASQSFLIPRTQEELAQIPYSLLPVLGAGFGVIVGATVLRKVLPNSPYLRRMMLEPRKRVETGLEGDSDPEAIVDWSHLAGEVGETVTKLYPSGKARIAGRVYDVVSSGQMVDKGEKVNVIQAQGNRIVVKPVSSDEA